MALRNWCTKYRYKRHVQGSEKYKNMAQSAIIEAAERHGIDVRQIAVAPDHRHVSADIPPPTMGPSRARWGAR
jgi:REP element-mobilizing transposase RayT